MAKATTTRGGGARGTSSILAWYESRRPMFIDLVGDYAGKELFLVEGDSMLRECFSDERIDFQDGFQLLHAVFVVERFLENLLKRHCNFHIAFFEENGELCIPPGQSATHRSRYLLARTVIKRHLSLRLPASHPHINIYSFPSLDSHDFKEYLHTSPIHFIMAHDGANTSLSASRDTVTEDGKFAKVILRGIIWFFNTHKLNVALINRIEFKDSKIFTMIVESFTTSSRLKLSMTKRFVVEIEETRILLNDSRHTKYPEQAISHKLDIATCIQAFPEEKIKESYLLSAYSASAMLGGDFDSFMPSAFVLHSVLLMHVPLSWRRLPLVTFDSDFEEEIELFLASISSILRNTIEAPRWSSFLASKEIESDTTDLVDGRLFRVVMQAMCDGSIKEEHLPPAVVRDWKVLCTIVSRLATEELSLRGSIEPAFSETTATESDFIDSSEDLAVLPFSNPVFNKHLECIHVSTEASLPERLKPMKIYQETSHWHNHRKPLNPKSTPAQKFSKWKNPLRNNQVYMSEMTNYAASLTGAKGKALDPEIITVGHKQLTKIKEKPQKPEKSSVSPKEDPKGLTAKEKKADVKKGTKKSAAGLSKIEQMRTDNLERKGGSEANKAFTSWATIIKNLDAISNDQDRYLRSVEFLNELDSAKTTHLEGDISAYILQSLLSWWATYCNLGTKSEGYHVVALIWTTIRSICTSRSTISKDAVSIVTKICNLLEITDALSTIISTGDRKLSFTFKFPSRNQILAIDMKQSEFQLEHCGPYMDRMLDAKPDPRVSSFTPDGWQRDVLDQIDTNKSVFVVAPTSAGKTFISFYAMEQVLRADNDGVLVYVAPTKALVNQIAAEVQGRFSKRFPVPGKGVWAIHTRDYRVNSATGCQILVTVPHILQIMLLSPSNARSWAPRVRRIIFDEIHSIGQAEDGIVWEQLLLLAPCPIIALSATVGNPEQFNDWLTETQKSSGSDLKMIQHRTRYSDLRKYMYEPPTTFSFAGLGKSYSASLGLDKLTGFQAFHPVSSLVDRSRGIPDDLALEPRDCLTLWKAIVRFQTDAHTVPSSLDPRKALPACIRKADIFAWEKELKAVLSGWMKDNDSPFDQVVTFLTLPEPAVNFNDAPLSSVSSLTNSKVINQLDLKETTLPLLLQLHKRRALPAILFNYDRSQCEKIASAVLSQLIKAESSWKQGIQWKKLIEGYEKYLEAKEKKLRKPLKPAKLGNKGEDEGGSKTDRMRENCSDGASIYDLFDPEAPQPDFSFANPKKLQKAELEQFIRALRWKKVKESLIDLLKRGIGVHHAGMNRKYRQCVEMLFRKGFLRVVIATGTLSLGINMPCATVVFSGDSVFLTALNFRQAGGRSGRRGFDLLGNVVFQGISRERASRLLSSRLPELTGHFPITTTLILRLFTLLADSKCSPYALKAINAMLSQPRLYLGGESFKAAVLHHLRFSIKYLRRNELLGPGGEPVNFTSCVSHLYFTENSSFAFHALLRGGYFHKLCADIDTKTDMVLYEMILTLSHIFGRRTCREVDDEEEAEKIKRSPSIVYLPAMPDNAAMILRKHNRDTLKIFTTYVKTFAAQNVKEEERHLPLTKTPVGLPPTTVPNGTINGDAQVNGSLNENVMSFLPSLQVPHARSAFVALSGHGDRFTTIEDLCSSVRGGVFLEAAVIPHLEIHPDETRNPLNAYLLDFFKHGSVDPLEKANGIRRSDVWFVLNDFSMVLATISTSLALYLGLGSSEDHEMLDMMGLGDVAENEEDEKEAAAEETTSTTTLISKFSTTTSIASVKNSKKVVDDWDAGEDAMAVKEDSIKSERSDGTGATDDVEYDKLMDVYKAFRMLKTEFDNKFRVIWA